MDINENLSMFPDCNKEYPDALNANLNSVSDIIESTRNQNSKEDSSVTSQESETCESCESHPRTVQCKECPLFLCDHCANGHRKIPMCKTHTFISIDGCKEQAKQILSTELQKYKQCWDMLKEVERNWVSFSQTLSEQKESISKAIDQSEQHLNSVVSEVHRRLRDDLEKRVSQDSNLVNENRSKITDQISTVAKDVQVIKNAMEENGNGMLLRKDLVDSLIKHLEQRCCYLKTFTENQIPPRPVKMELSVPDNTVVSLREIQLTTERKPSNTGEISNAKPKFSDESCAKTQNSYSNQHGSSKTATTKVYNDLLTSKHPIKPTDGSASGKDLFQKPSSIRQTHEQVVKTERSEIREKHKAFVIQEPAETSSETGSQAANEGEKKTDTTAYAATAKAQRNHFFSTTTPTENSERNDQPTFKVAPKIAPKPKIVKTLATIPVKGANVQKSNELETDKPGSDSKQPMTAVGLKKSILDPDNAKQDPETNAGTTNVNIKAKTTVNFQAKENPENNAGVSSTKPLESLGAENSKTTSEATLQCPPNASDQANGFSTSYVGLSEGEPSTAAADVNQSDLSRNTKYENLEVKENPDQADTVNLEAEEDFETAPLPDANIEFSPPPLKSSGFEDIEIRSDTKFHFPSNGTDQSNGLSNRNGTNAFLSSFKHPRAAATVKPSAYPTKTAIPVQSPVIPPNPVGASTSTALATQHSPENDPTTCVIDPPTVFASQQDQQELNECIPSEDTAQYSNHIANTNQNQNAVRESDAISFNSDVTSSTWDDDEDAIYQNTTGNHGADEGGAIYANTNQPTEAPPPLLKLPPPSAKINTQTVKRTGSEVSQLSIAVSNANSTTLTPLFLKMRKKKYKKKMIYQYRDIPCRIACVNEELWTVMSNGDIYVLTLKGVFLRSISAFGRLNTTETTDQTPCTCQQHEYEIKAMCQAPDGNIIVACDGIKDVYSLHCTNTELGLFIIDEHGSIQQTLGRGRYWDVAKGSNFIFALSAKTGDNQAVTIFQTQEANSYQCLRSITMPDYEYERILVYDIDNIYLSSIVSNQIHRLCLQNSELEEFGSEGNSSDVGSLDGPLLCKLDAENCLLIADRAHDRLQLLDKDKQWYTFPLYGVKDPYDAEIHVDTSKKGKSRVFVISDDGSLYKFSPSIL